MLNELSLLGVDEVGDALLGVAQGVGPQLGQEGLEPELEQPSPLVVAEHEVGEHGEGVAEPVGVRGLKLDRNTRGGPGHGGHEEPGHRDFEGAGEGDDLVGVEHSDAVAVDGSLGGREAGPGPATTEVRGEGLGRLLLGPPLVLARLRQVVGDVCLLGDVDADIAVPAADAAARLGAVLAIVQRDRAPSVVPDAEPELEAAGFHNPSEFYDGRTA